MWFQAHESLVMHPKTLRLARFMKCSQNEAIGTLWRLFAWALTAAKSDGQLPGVEPEDIAVAAGYPMKDAERIMDALIKSGYIEHDQLTEEYFIHDWQDYGGKLAEQKELKSNRQRRYRDGKNVKE